MLKSMAQNKGDFVFGSDYELGIAFGLMTRAFVESIRDSEANSAYAFSQNYMSEWVGNVTDALVKMEKMQTLRSEKLKPQLERNPKKDEEIIISMDVSRSQSDSNNKTSFVVGKIVRTKSGKIDRVEIVNIITMPNGCTFSEQTAILKRLQKKYKAKRVVVDHSGIGKAVVDLCLEETYDEEEFETYEAWNTMNVDGLRSKIEDAPEMVYAINASGINSDIITNFWDYVESGKVRFLTDDRQMDIDETEAPFIQNAKINAHKETDKLMDELSNLKTKEISKGKYSVQQVTKKIDKDRYSALVYLLYYIQNFEIIEEDKEMDYLDFILAN